jgi:hypothetical protein
MPDFTWYITPKRGEIYHITTKILIGTEIYQMAIKRPTSSIARPFKIYPNCDFRSENIPSGNACVASQSGIRVAKWFVFKPKIPIGVNFGGSC